MWHSLDPFCDPKTTEVINDALRVQIQLLLHSRATQKGWCFVVFFQPICQMPWGQMKWDVQIVSACVGLSHQQLLHSLVQGSRGECGNLQEIQYLEENALSMPTYELHI